MGFAKKRVALIVDGDPEVHEAMAPQFAAMGFEATIALDFYSALSHLEARAPDIVVVSLRLPNESGYQLCEYMRGSPAFEMIPIIVTCDGESIEDMANVEDAGASAVLERPFTRVQFARSVESLLAQGDRAMAPQSSRALRRTGS